EVRDDLRRLGHQRLVGRLLDLAELPLGQLRRGDAPRMAVEVAGLEQAELVRADPLALVVRVEELAPRRERDAARRAQPRAHRLPLLAVEREAQREAAPVDVAEGLLAEGTIERDPQLAVAVEHRPERVLVIVAADLPRIRERLELVRV